MVFLECLNFLPSVTLQIIRIHSSVLEVATVGSLEGRVPRDLVLP